MTASTPELITLIYRHLKEHGFHTAAEELQKHSLQVSTHSTAQVTTCEQALCKVSEAPTSTTLQDVYSSWLKSSKRKTKSATSKRSAPDKKQTTPNKANPQKKKTGKTTKQAGSPNKKQKNGDGNAAEKLVKSSTSKGPKKEDEGREDSDSDSSLDVEKWKRLVEQMTDADLAKVEALNALVDPEPKKPRVRKPRAKPNPKTETPTGKQEQLSKTSDKTTEDKTAKSANVISTTRQSPKKEKRKATTDQATTEPKQKKKKTATVDNAIVNATDRIIDKNLEKDAKTPHSTELRLTKGSQQNTTNDQTGSKTKKRDTTQNKVTANATDGEINKNADYNKNDQTSNQTTIKLKEGSPEKMSSLQTESKKKKKDATHSKVTAKASDRDAVIDKHVDNKKDVNTSDQTTVKLPEGSPEKASNLQTESKKKKKKDATPSKVTANASEGDADKNVDNIEVAISSNPTIELTEGSAEKSSNIQPEPKKKNKKIEGEDKVTVDVLVDQNVEINTVEDINGNLETDDLISSLNTSNAESIEKAKKKKKKKDKTKENGEQAVTEAKLNALTNEGTCEKAAVESGQDTVETVPKKKKKKKDKDKEELETLQQENVIAETVDVEETQQIIVKKKSKKKKKEGEEHLETEGEQVKTPVTLDSNGKVPEETPDVMSTPQTPGSKKKKHKLKIKELTEADAVSQMQESETPKKKKKTSSKSKETES
ncbi:LOW QUALITY PROTEIN: nucleolar and coiled-body phosphoprotein 1-like [Boleophthalmus pectinirostris]|uniref:LOW QUALITY PROTEIN: nucleolar and coiled-body phosphoprotein 1-like n=1 Tax=Boleophthalmus pectinirostris TaxID=150288 RepID=UPI00242D4FC6|nr:LOW QUALITY PROTEIN: nucleolar and coiled-body phosphoprotein 1-like [Boleophthalmus pectinirostris]